MDVYAAQVLQGPVAIRYRGGLVDHRVELCVGGSIAAFVQGVQLDGRHSLGEIAAGVLGLGLKRVGERDQQPDWVMTPVRGGDPIAVARQLEAPRELHDSTDAVHQIESSGIVIATLPRGGFARDARAIQLASGAHFTYETAETKSRYAAEGVLRDSAGAVLVRLLRSDRPDMAALVPRDGAIGAMDLVLLPEPVAQPEVRLAALFAALLNTQARDTDFSGDLGYSHTRPDKAPVGMTRKEASEAERKRQRDLRADQHLNRLQERMRAAGRGELADRLEEKRHHRD